MRIEILTREPAFNGLRFGDIGRYERLVGRAFCEADPAHRLNAEIVNLAHAPRNELGCVEFSFDFCLLKPIELGRTKGWLFYEFPNRGTQRAFTRINNGPSVPSPTTAEHVGNAFLMRRGYTILWSAWQGNVEPGDGRMLADLPVPLIDGRPVVGQSREEVELDAPDSIRGAIVEELSPTCFALRLSYPAASLDPAGASLTVRAYERSERRSPDCVSWRFLDDRAVEITTSPDSGVDRGAIYEFIYTARDPVVMGLGYAGVRDLVSFFRHDAVDDEGNPNPLFDGDVPRIRRAIGFGLSQSGRVLRDFLYQGFNEDLRGRPVFDGAVPVISGSRKGGVNRPFALPGRYSREHEDHLYPGDQFPFGYSRLTDPISGRTDGLLERAKAAGVVPMIMQLDTDSEVWSARASLIVTDCDGNDIDLPETVRVYLTASIAHGNYPLPQGPPTRHATNPVTYGPILRALLVAMEEWVEDGVDPPPSHFPSRAGGTLQTLDEFTRAFPKIPGMASPDRVNALFLVNHDTQPPTTGTQPYPVYVTAVDADGNGSSGVRHPLVQVPLGTHTGWAIRAKGFAEGALYSVYGSYMPFAPDSATRAATDDPRRSIVERYPDRETWVEALARACETLVAERLLLREDADELLSRAAESWSVWGAI